MHCLCMINWGWFLCYAVSLTTTDFPPNRSEDCWCSLSAVVAVQTAASSPLMPYNSFKYLSSPRTHHHTPHLLLPLPSSNFFSQTEQLNDFEETHLKRGKHKHCIPTAFFANLHPAHQLALSDRTFYSHFIIVPRLCCRDKKKGQAFVSFSNMSGATLALYICHQIKEALYLQVEVDMEKVAVPYPELVYYHCRRNKLWLFWHIFKAKIPT